MNKYLKSLMNTAINIDSNLFYGYGDDAITEINSLKALIAKSEEMIPILETEACMAEAEELDREERSFNYWMTMLYGNDSVSPVDTHNINKTNRLKRRKANKKHHKADRYHGKKLMVVEYKEDHEIKEGLSWLYRDCHCPVGNDVKYSTNTVKAREQEYISAFSEKGELMDKVEFLDEAISFGEREIENLEYEKAFGYLSDRGDAVIEECKRNLSELKDYKEDILRIIHSATR